jgi:hypothetical protein
VPLAAALTGCGIPATDPLPFGEPAGGVEIGQQMYFLLDGKIFPTLRRIDGRDPAAVVNALAAGPLPEEQAAGLTTQVPAGLRVVALPGPRTDRTQATDEQLTLLVVGLANDPTQLPELAVTQLVCTAVTAYRRDGYRATEIILTDKAGRARPATGCPVPASPGDT